jgi:hypothetical protein
MHPAYVPTAFARGFAAITPPGPDLKALGFAPPPGLAPNSLNCGCAQSVAHSGTHVDSPKDLPSPPPFRASAIRIASRPRAWLSFGSQGPRCMTHCGASRPVMWFGWVGMGAKGKTCRKRLLQEALTPTPTACGNPAQPVSKFFLGPL